MKMLTTSVLVALLFTSQLFCQANYKKDLRAFRTMYMYKHEVVKGKDIQYFRFFTIDSNYHVTGNFERIIDTVGFTMKTSAGTTQAYFKYGKINFRLKNVDLQLFVYQSKALIQTSYRDYLFIPFTDSTTGDKSYGSGRYIDLLSSDIKGNQLTIDFNKAYNPYCAYANGYHCPLPPRENFVPFAIKAGEMAFGKPHHYGSK